jgi:tellurium resistance protein TerD
MAINLSKGQKIDLTKTSPGLTKITVGLGWDVNKYDSGAQFDLDAAAFLLGENGKASGDADFVFYNNKEHSSGGVIYSGDNRTGDGEGDDETIKVDLSKIPASIEKVDFTVTIDQADTRNQNFGQVEHAYIRVVKDDDGTELIRYDLGEDYSTETTIVVAQLYRNGEEWKFSAVGSGFAGGLAALCRNYGLDA